MLDRPPLHQAFLLKQRASIPHLIEECNDINEKDRVGDSAIMYAAQYGWVPELDLLLKAGADIETQDSETNTPIILIVGRKKKEAFDYLMLNSSLEQLNSFKSQLYRAHMDSHTFGLKSITKEQLDDAYEKIEKAALERRLTLSLEDKPVTKPKKI